jgi:hypothetical protein
MGAEGAIAITAGILAGSIALISFGIDSAIEVWGAQIHLFARGRFGADSALIESALSALWWRESALGRVAGVPVVSARARGGGVAFAFA